MFDGFANRVLVAASECWKTRSPNQISDLGPLRYLHDLTSLDLIANPVGDLARSSTHEAYGSEPELRDGS